MPLFVQIVGHYSLFLLLFPLSSTLDQQEYVQAYSKTSVCKVVDTWQGKVPFQRRLTSHYRGRACGGALPRSPPTPAKPTLALFTQPPVIRYAFHGDLLVHR